MISIVICTYNRANLLERTINSVIESYNYSGIKEVELLIVDNNSKDNTTTIVEKLSNDNSVLRYIKEINVGLSFARNRGIKESKGEYIVFLDDDVLINKDYISNLNSFIFENKNIVCIGGKIDPDWQTERPSWFSDEFASIIGQTRYGDNTRSLKSPEYPIGANMIFKKTIFNEVGYFDTNLGIKGDTLFLGEENDICDRIAKQGYEIYYVPNLICYHLVDERKVNKEYILNRLSLEGVSMAQWNIKTLENKELIKKALIKRYGILLIRDIPLFLFNKLIKSPNYFMRECKYARSNEYIKYLKKYLQTS